MGLYLRLNKELEKGSFSTIVFCLLLMKFLAFSLLHSSLDWFCARIVRRLLVEVRERESMREKGVPDRIRERKPGSNSDYYLVEPL